MKFPMEKRELPEQVDEWIQSDGECHGILRRNNHNKSWFATVVFHSRERVTAKVISDGE
jgi:hypothetical protein